MSDQVAVGAESAAAEAAIAIEPSSIITVAATNNLPRGRALI
jgi:hypothetical protein